MPIYCDYCKKQQGNTTQKEAHMLKCPGNPAVVALHIEEREKEYDEVLVAAKAELKNRVKEDMKKMWEEMQETKNTWDKKIKSYRGKKQWNRPHYDEICDEVRQLRAENETFKALIPYMLPYRQGDGIVKVIPDNLLDTIPINERAEILLRICEAGMLRDEDKNFIEHKWQMLEQFNKTFINTWDGMKQIHEIRNRAMEVYRADYFSPQPTRFTYDDMELKRMFAPYGGSCFVKEAHEETSTNMAQKLRKLDNNNMLHKTLQYLCNDIIVPTALTREELFDDQCIQEDVVGGLLGFAEKKLPNELRPDLKGRAKWNYLWGKVNTDEIKAYIASKTKRRFKDIEQEDIETIFKNFSICHEACYDKEDD